MKKAKFGTEPIEIKKNCIIVRENTDLYKKDKKGKYYNVIEDTDKYKKSGKKLIKKIKLDL